MKVSNIVLKLSLFSLSRPVMYMSFANLPIALGQYDKVRGTRILVSPRVGVSQLSPWSSRVVIEMT